MLGKLYDSPLRFILVGRHEARKNFFASLWYEKLSGSYLDGEFTFLCLSLQFDKVFENLGIFRYRGNVIFVRTLQLD